MSKTAPAKHARAAEKTTPSFGAKTILFNDEVHTFEEVARQLVKATGCTYGRGMTLANVVHYTGSAIVYMGPVERCEAVAMVLEDIKLKTLVER